MTAHLANGMAIPDHVQSILDRLGNVKPRGKGWRALCPVHGDRTPSLDVDIGDGGVVLLACRSQRCKPEDIVKAIGLTIAGLWPKDRDRKPTPAKPVQTYRTAEQAVAAWERKYGRLAHRWDYHDADGGHVGSVLRWEPPGQGKIIRPIARHPDGWRRCAMLASRPLYGLPALAGAAQVIIVEGEKCADAARSIGFVATTTAGGSQAANKSDLSPLADKTVLIVPDNDPPGRKYALDLIDGLAKPSPAPRVWVAELPGLDVGGDLDDWLALKGDGADPEAIKAEIEALAIRADDYLKKHRPLVNDNPELPAPKQSPQGFRFDAVSSAEFFAQQHVREWFIRNVVVRLQPGVIGGASKTLKTSIAIHMAVSLGSGTRFLGRFEAVKTRVGFLSGESGAATIQDTARRICASQGVDPFSLDVFWGFRLPRLSNPEDMAYLRVGLRERGIRILFVDPLYLSLLSGQVESRLQASSLFDLGPLLLSVAETCLVEGCTPILLHHSKKVIEPGKPMELPDLSFAGIAEFSRQWFLLSRREPFDKDTGRHELIANVGGSAGHSSLWALDIDEGVMGEDFTGRRWQVEIRPESEARRDQIAVKEQEKKEKAFRALQEDAQALMKAIDQLAADGGWAQASKAREAANLSEARMTRAVLELRQATLIEAGKLEVATGRNLKVRRPVDALRRVNIE